MARNGSGLGEEADIAATWPRTRRPGAHLGGQQIGIAFVAGDIDALEIAADRGRRAARRRPVVSASVP